MLLEEVRSGRSDSLGSLLMFLLLVSAVNLSRKFPSAPVLLIHLPVAVVVVVTDHLHASVLRPQIPLACGVVPRLELMLSLSHIHECPSHRH